MSRSISEGENYVSPLGSTSSARPQGKAAPAPVAAESFAVGTSAVEERQGIPASGVGKTAGGQSVAASPQDAGGGSGTGGSGTIVDHMLGDEPATTENDRLGFKPYVSAVAQFLTDPSTKIPLTLSVEGLWGSGKSSFMLQLQEALRARGKRRIVSFNAWQYDAGEGLWAAFIHDFDKGMNSGLGPVERLKVRLRLAALRISWQDGFVTAKALIWLLASGFVLGEMFRYFVWQHGLTALSASLRASGEIQKAAVTSLALIGGAGGTVAALLLFLNQLKALFKSPASVEKTAKFFAKPNYDSRLPLIAEVTRDFDSLVKAYAGKDEVYLFVDDLDRCDYARAAELMQALLMLLGSAPQIALIIGLDREKVAAAMAAKQEKLLPYLYKVQPAAAYELGMEYGQRFLEKFIQVSYFLPVPGKDGLKAMINPELKTPVAAAESEKSPRAIEIATGKDDSGTLDKMIEMADEVFEHNPRNVKQFVNMFRLQAFLANETGLFGSLRVTRGTGVPLTIPQLGKFVVLCMRWPEFIEAAALNPKLVEDAERWMNQGRFAVATDTYETSEDLLNGWAGYPGLKRLLRFGLPWDEFSIAGLDFDTLMRVAPARLSSISAGGAAPPLRPSQPPPPQPSRPQAPPAAKAVSAPTKSVRESQPQRRSSVLKK